MVGYNDTTMGGANRGFMTTQWTMVEWLRKRNSMKRRRAENWIVASYWMPAYVWLRISGYNDADSKDLVQDYFKDSFENNRFKKADRKKGKFRDYFLECLKNFVFNENKKAHAVCRHPKGGYVCIDQYDTTGMTFDLADNKTPDYYFHRTWLLDLLLRTVERLKQAFYKKGMRIHYKLFFKRIVEPALIDRPKPSMEKLAAKAGMPVKKACNLVETTKRAFVRLLVDEIQKYADSKSEVILETRDVLRILLPPK